MTTNRRTLKYAIKRGVSDRWSPALDELTNVPNVRTGHLINGTLLTGDDHGRTVTVPMDSAVFTRAHTYGMAGSPRSLSYEVYALTTTLDLILIAQPSAAGLQDMLDEIGAADLND